MGDVVLQTHRLTRRFGGLIAANDVSLRLELNALHALLGPNGAGKSTVINLLSGALAPTSGRIELRGNDIASLAPHDRSRLGMGRSFQKTNVFPEFTVLENCRLAAQSRNPRPWRWLSSAQNDRESLDGAHRALEAVDLARKANRIASHLSHGEQRQLELAMVLATEPQVLLLDEPLAGMGVEESARMVELIAKLAPEHAILLVEHDMDAVFTVARTITVMVDGSVIASGAPEVIRSDPNVQRAYLGEPEVHD